VYNSGSLVKTRKKLYPDTTFLGFVSSALTAHLSTEVGNSSIDLVFFSFLSTVATLEVNWQISKWYFFQSEVEKIEIKLFFGDLGGDSIK